MVFVRLTLTRAAPLLPGISAWPAGLPWPAVFILTLLGVVISAGLTFVRLYYRQVQENHHHDEVMTVLNNLATTSDATALITALRVTTPSSSPNRTKR